MNRTSFALSGALPLLFASSAVAQSLSSSYSMLATNVDYKDADGTVYNATLAEGQNPSGGPISSDFVQSFTGYDAAGDSQTMTFAATTYASAQYKQLKARASGTLTNAYYNPALNAPYFRSDTGETDPNGSPDVLSAVSSARFSDTLTFGNFSTSYKIQYVFRFHGTLTGDSVNSDLYFGVGSDYKNVSPLSFGSRGAFDQIVATDKIAVTEGFQHSVSANLFVQFTPNTFQYDGRDAAGTVDFASTATLLGLYVTDANGNEVTDWTVSSASGTFYEQAQAVPEPTSVAALAIGGLGLLARRRRRVP